MNDIGSCESDRGSNEIGKAKLTLDLGLLIVCSSARRRPGFHFILSEKRAIEGRYAFICCHYN